MTLNLGRKENKLGRISDRKVVGNGLQITIKETATNRNCNTCKTFNKESELLERIERRCISLSRSEDLQNIVAMPSHKETPKNLKSFIRVKVLPSLTGAITHYKPKLLARLANTFLLTAKCGSAHHDIDQPLDQASIDELRWNSVNRCQSDSPS